MFLAKLPILIFLPGELLSNLSSPTIKFYLAVCLLWRQWRKTAKSSHVEQGGGLDWPGLVGWKRHVINAEDTQSKMSRKLLIPVGNFSEVNESPMRFLVGAVRDDEAETESLGECTSAPVHRTLSEQFQTWEQLNDNVIIMIVCCCRHTHLLDLQRKLYSLLEAGRGMAGKHWRPELDCSPQGTR